MTLSSTVPTRVFLVHRAVHDGSWRASDAKFSLCGSLALLVFVCIAPGFVSATSVGPYGRATTTVSLSSVVLFTVVPRRASDAEFLLCGSLALWLFVCIASGFVSTKVA